MKKLLIGYMAIVLMGAGCGGGPKDTPEAEAKRQEIENKISDVTAASTAFRDQAALMVQIGSLGVDARKREDWAERSKQASKLLADKKTSEAINLIESVNAEMRAMIAASKK